jgi:hypothetical protein
MTEIILAEDSFLVATPHIRIADQGVVFDRRVSLEEYGVWGTQLLYFWNSAPFYVGDTMLYGEQMIGQEFSQFFERHYSDQTISNYMSVCRRVPLENRRIHELPFGHHEAVAALPAAEQRAWLQKSIDNGWHRDELRAAIRGLPPAVIESPPFDGPQAPKARGVDLPLFGNERELEEILLAAFDANSRGDSALVGELLDKAIQKVRG